jgi:hypothetical protein
MNTKITVPVVTDEGKLKMPKTLKESLEILDKKLEKLKKIQICNYDTA